MAGLFEQRDLMTPQAQQRAIEAGIARPEDFVGGRPVKVAPTGPLYKSGSSAEEDAARARGITIQQKRAEADAQLQELLKKRKAAGYAGGGRVKPAYTGTTPREPNPWIRNLQALNPLAPYDPTVEQEPLFEQEANTYDERMDRAQSRFNEFAADMVLDPFNLVGGAVLGKLLKGTAAVGKRALAPTSMAVGSAAYGSDAEAGKLGALTGLQQKMLQMMYRGRSSYTPIEERAMFMSPSPRYAEEYAKRRVGQIGGERTVDSYLVDPFAVERRGHNITPTDGGNMQSMIAYPKADEAEYKGSRNFSGGGVIGGLGRIARHLAGEPTKKGVGNIIKERGGQWLNGVNTVEDAFRGELRNVDDPVLANALRIAGRSEDSLNEARALDNWIKGPLTKYVKKDFATEKDPVRALAEQGILHVKPEQLHGDVATARRYPWPGQKIVGKNEAAQTWEVTADNAVLPKKALEYQKNVGKNWESNKWLDDADPATPVHSIRDKRQFTSDTGFDHMLEELSNALDPESGLPPHLRITPDQLKSGNFSVDGAVRHVAKINDWREAQKIEANKVRANNAATHLHKDYGDGYKWVQLKSPAKRKDGELSVDDMFDEQAAEKAGYAQLKDALKYEGEAMKHCVGGYCDDVAEGRSQIFSLRDANGQPHATVEVIPPGKIVPITDEMRAERSYLRPHDRFMDIDTGFGHESEQVLPEIKQIKGGANSAPKAEYLPYVQDFVKSGKWSDVGDLQNTGLVRRADGAFEVDTPEGAKFRQDALDELHADDNNFAKGGLIDFHALHGYN